MRGLWLRCIFLPTGIDIRKDMGDLEESGDAWKNALFLRRHAPALQKHSGTRLGKYLVRCRYFCKGLRKSASFQAVYGGLSKVYPSGF